MKSCRNMLDSENRLNNHDANLMIPYVEKLVYDKNFFAISRYIAYSA